MDGCSIIVISGIDGHFEDFTDFIQPHIHCKDCLKLAYDRTISFAQNIQEMRLEINKVKQKCCLIGWSIGAAAVAFLADCPNVKSVIMINSFFSRAETLKLRNIFCDEEVCLSETKKQPVQYTIIAGVQDDKIPYTESVRIADFYQIDQQSLICFENSSHRLSTFPLKEIAELINNSL